MFQAGMKSPAIQELTYNIFYFVDDGIINETAIRSHNRVGTDEEKLAWLRSNVVSDLPRAIRVPMSKPISQDALIALQRLGRHLEVFEPLFQSVGASSSPLCCITPIVDGAPKIDIVTDHSPLTAEVMQSPNVPALNSLKDWLTEYITEKGFDIPRLLNDDYFSAIRLLFNSRKYVSCVKLLVSFIDTISFIAYGDERDVFKRWLGRYVSLRCLGITSDELWEMRNGILHMSNLDSRKVRQKEVRRIAFCIATRGDCSPADQDVTYFNLLDLIEAIAAGLSNWIHQMNANPDGLVKFVERYDRSLSDARVMHVKKL